MIDFPLTINNNPVSQVRSIRYLGVTLDSKLKWGIHWNRIIQNAKQHLIIIPQKNPTYLNGIIRPKILYCAMNLGHTLKPQKIKDQFEKLDSTPHDNSRP